MRWTQRQPNTTWHRWFAWHPVRVLSGRTVPGHNPVYTWVWLEWVERIKYTRAPNPTWLYEVRLPAPKHKYPTIDELRAERRAQR